MLPRRPSASRRPGREPATGWQSERDEHHGGNRDHRAVEVVRTIEAVRDIDVSVAPGETVALLGPNGAGKSTTIDMLLGLLEPDAGSVSVFGSPPTAAVDRGAVGAMLQTGALLRDLTGRELVSMMAGLYPTPLPVDDVARADRDRALRGSADAEALRWPDAAGALCDRAGLEPRPARPGRADGRPGRRGPPRLLGDDAGRSRRKDGPFFSRPTISRRRMRSPTASC